MLQETFVKEYFKNPFLLWSLIVAGLTTFDSVFFANMAMQAIVIHQLYVPILFGSLTFVFIQSFYPIRNGLVEFGKKESKITAIAFVVSICLMFYVEVIFFMIAPYEIFATLSPEAVLDKNTFQIGIYAKDLIELLALPLLAAFSFANIKSKLVKGRYKVNDNIRNNLKFVAYIVIINSLTYLLFIFLTNQKL
ncbi:MAG: hypothetical protein AUH25_04870 [Thaumarchaeota archaeon 13_1_40CM_38_12]|nr:MAG: hypothetical protein AUH25_04870 [Thaumarchaeota archaeon 13_1_40CM_38_12]OLC33509.1 MAG: hypothetical protein AUH84_06910 [Thaumarchaeota archaeon 13_1_40CM_4_38_7]